MRSRTGLALIILVEGAFAALAEGDGFVRNYEAWSALSESSKSAYAMGTFDDILLSRETAEDLADNRGLATCAIADGFTPKFLGALIDAQYAGHSENGMPDPPASLLMR
jgi:hypothetical protein